MNFSLEMIEVYRFQSVSRVLYVHPSTGVSPHTPLSSPPPPCRLQPLLLFCSVCFGVILLFLWRGCIQLYIYYTTLLLHCCSTHPPLWWWIDKKPAATVAWLTTYRCLFHYTHIRGVYVYMCRAKNDNEGTLYNGNELVLYTLWWWPHVATRGTESR